MHNHEVELKLSIKVFIQAITQIFPFHLNLFTSDIIIFILNVHVLSISFFGEFVVCLFNHIKVISQQENYGDKSKY